MSKKNQKQPEMLVIRNKYQLWNDFIVPGMEKRVERELIRAQLKEAIRKEVFDQICWRTKVMNPSEAPHTPENERIVENIVKETLKKWMALVKMCDSRIRTFNLISESDLVDLFEDPNDIWDDEDSGYEFGEAEDPEEETGNDWDGDEETAEWPELATSQIAEPETPFKPIVDVNGNLVPQEFPAGYWV